MVLPTVAAGSLIKTGGIFNISKEILNPAAETLYSVAEKRYSKASCTRRAKDQSPQRDTENSERVRTGGECDWVLNM